jgi:hypothetical protein
MIAGALKHLRLLAGDTPPRMVELTGVLASSALPVDALYVGSGMNQAFLTELVMDDPRERARGELRGYRQVASAASGPLAAAPSVVLTDLPPLWGALTPRRAQFRFPAWIRQELVVPASGARWVVSRSVEREAARLARRHEYSVDFAVDETAVGRFYHELYRPYVLARFGAEAVVVAEAAFVQQARRWTLARLFRRKEWVAGLLLETQRHSMRFRWFGAATEPPPPGASEVLDVACVRHASETGIARIHLGHSRPSLVDGVVRYKMRLGGEIRAVRYPQAVLGIVVNRTHTALLDRLNARQLVGIRGRSATVLQAS